MLQRRRRACWAGESVETGSEHLAEFYEMRIMLSDCEEALKTRFPPVCYTKPMPDPTTVIAIPMCSESVLEQVLRILPQIMTLMLSVIVLSFIILRFLPRYRSKNNIEILKGSIAIGIIFIGLALLSYYVDQFTNTTMGTC